MKCISELNKSASIRPATCLIKAKITHLDCLAFLTFLFSKNSGVLKKVKYGANYTLL